MNTKKTLVARHCPTADRHREDLESGVTDDCQGQHSCDRANFSAPTKAAGRHWDARVRGCGKETSSPEFSIRQEDPLKAEENTDISDKWKLREFVINRQETLKEVFQAEEKRYRVETRIYKKAWSMPEIVKMWPNVLKYCFFLNSLKYIWVLKAKIITLCCAVYNKQM